MLRINFVQQLLPQRDTHAPQVVCVKEGSRTVCCAHSDDKGAAAATKAVIQQSWPARSQQLLSSCGAVERSIVRKHRGHVDEESYSGCLCSWSVVRRHRP